MQSRKPFLLLLLGFSWWHSLLGQQSSPTLSANFNNTELQFALNFFERIYDLSFSYDDEAVKGVRVTVRFKKLPLHEAMQRTLNGTGLGFEVLDNQYVLIKKLDNAPASPPMPPASKPEYSLCGTILDAETGEPLPGATAHIQGTPHGTTTNEQGKFKLEGDFSKDDSLIISYLGYLQQGFLVRPLLVKPCQEYRLHFAMLHIPDVIIRDFATDMIKVADGGNGFHFDKAKMPTLPGWGEPDVLRTLQLLPGIGSADESGARLNVRGGTPDQNLILLDGIPIYHTGHFFGLYDAFNPFVVDEVDVWRGNFGANYGGRNSSVIDISSKSGYGKKARYGIGMNLLSIQGFLDVPLRKNRMSLLFAFRRSYIDGLQSTAYKNFFNQIFQNGKVTLQEKATDESEFITWNPVINFGDANLKLRWLGKKSQENALSFFSTSDRLDYQFAYDDGNYYTGTLDVVAASNAGMSWQHSAEWSPKFKVKYHAAFSAYLNDYTFQWNEEVRERPFIYQYTTKNHLNELSANFQHDWQVNDRHRMSFGYQFTGQEAGQTYRDTNAVTGVGHLFWADTVRTALHTFFADFAYNVSDRFDFNIGIRETYFPSRDLYYSEPRLNFNWFPFGKKPDVNFKVKGSLGRYWQFIYQVIELGDLGVGEPLWRFVGENEEALELWQRSIGLSVESKTTLLDLEYYHKSNRNLTSLNLRGERELDIPWSFDGNSVARGIDLLLRKRWRNYSLWLSYSRGEVNMQFPELNGGQPYPARHDIRDRWNWVNTYSWKKWEFAANLHLRSGTPYSVPGVVQVPCPDCTADSLTYALKFEQLNTQRLPNIFRLDLSATWKWKKKRNHGKVGIAIYNATNRRNLLDKDYLLETPALDQPQDSYQLQELYRLAARATPSIFVMTEW